MGYYGSSSRNGSATAGFKRLLLLILVGGLLGYLGYQGWLFLQVRETFPAGTLIGNVEVSGLSPAQAYERVETAYSRPVMAMYHDEVVEVSPADAGFVINTAGMIEEATAKLEEVPYWERYIAFVLEQPLEPLTVRLRASHDPTAVREIVLLIADLLDQPAVSPQLLTDTGFIQTGTDGFRTDVETSAQRIEEALYKANNRTAEVAITEDIAPEISLAFLEEHIRNQLESFDGIGSIYVLDLQTGEEVHINADAAISGLSVVKVAIMIEMFRAKEMPLDADTDKLLRQTAINSGNFSANLLLDVVAGQDNAYLGVDILTESMHRLGLPNTFIATPYEERPRPGKTTYTTPANTRTDLFLDPDPAMQTTAEEMGQLLAMIYYCTQGGGALLAAYPDQLTPEECQYLLDVMTLNTEGNLIRFGVPETVHVAHKHGWAYNTHGDAGIVFSPGGDFVIAQYLYQDSDWLNAGESFPLLREITRSVYNYFNIDDPYVDHKRAQKAAGKHAIELVTAKLESGEPLQNIESVPTEELESIGDAPISAP
ncbi:MAG: serine hydrolase [Anaerolineales bacterium]|nr:serine hydrolase [Anaerolineales bacterium]